MLIHKSLLKYGYSNFSVEILEYCDPSEAILREQYYIDLLNPEYNILKIAGSLLGFKHSEEGMMKILASWDEERKAKMSEAMKGNKIARGRRGLKHSEETKAKIKAAWSEERKDKFKAAMKGNTHGTSVKIEVFDQETGKTTIYPSMTDLAASLGVTKSCISKYFSRNTQKPFKGRYLLQKL